MNDSQAMNEGMSLGGSYWQYQMALRGGLPPEPTGVQRLAWALRRWADRLDGRWSLSFEYRTAPYLSRAVLAQCLHGGLASTTTLIESELQRITVEHVLRQEYPELYGESQTSRSA